MKNFDKFYSEFQFAQTPEEKRKLIEDLEDDMQFSDEELKELYEQINDLIQNEATDEDVIISMEIEDGKYQLYTCFKDIDSYKSNSNYYVKVDDARELYLSTGIGETNPVIQSLIDTIKPIYYIVTDDGIGTLKRKNIFSKDFNFSDYFTKFA